MDVSSPLSVDFHGKSIYALDISLLMFQYFHAIDQMTSPRGQPTNCVFGLLRDILYLLDERKADGILAAIDLPGKTFRDELFADYKQTRSETPPELIEQVPLVDKLLSALGIPRLGIPGFEADDIMASIARQFEGKGANVFLVTLDKDCRQLITDKIRIFDIRKHQEIGAAELHELWGVRPDQVADYQSLVGDSIDNVPGVPLIGPKIASQLLNQYHDLEGIYAHLQEMPAGKRKSNLESYRETVMLSRKLVELRKDLPLSVAWDHLTPTPADYAAAGALASELGFRRFTEILRSRSGAPLVQQPPRSALVIASKSELDALAAEIQDVGTGQVAIRFVANHARARWAQPIGYALAWLQKSCYVPIDPGQLNDPTAPWRIPLCSLLGQPQAKLVGYDLKYDLIVLKGLGFAKGTVHFDPLLGAFVLDAGSRDLSLSAITRKFAMPESAWDESLLDQDMRSPAAGGVLTLAEAATEQSRAALHLCDVMLARLANTDLQKLLTELEIPLVPVLADMEYEGVCVDKSSLRKLSQVLAEQIQRLESEIHAEAGHPFNIASPKQLATVLFEELKLPGVKKTKSGQSTDMEVLEKLAEIHPLPAKIIEYRHFAKLKGTYADALPELIHPVTGRIHTSFSQVAAATGRLSSADPNLQNIPIRSEIGNQIRSAFVAGPVHPGTGGLPEFSHPSREIGRQPKKLIAADYSQIELRVLAHFSQDPSLLDAFVRNEDIHTRVAAEIHHVPAESVTPNMRRVAKTVNFGVIYGQSAFGLAKSLKIENEEAARFIDAYFQRYPGIVQFMEDVLDGCLRDGYVSTIAGRRRPVEGVRPARDRSVFQRNLAERTAVNAVIQGSAADLMKRAMIQVHDCLERSHCQSKLLLQIHDELLLEAPADEVDQVAEWVQAKMESAYELTVPLLVEVEVGTNWANCEKWEHRK